MLYQFHVSNNLTQEELRSLGAVNDPPFRIYCIEASSLDEAWGQYELLVKEKWDHVSISDPEELKGNKFMRLSDVDKRKEVNAKKAKWGKKP
jgi:hypothetical protein